MRTIYPDWLKAQKGRTFHVRRGFMGKFAVVKQFAVEQAREGSRITHDEIRDMLVYLDRGYKTDPQAISRLLHGVHGGRAFEKYPNGHRISVNDEGGTRYYKSLNQAAKAEGCSPQSVLNWASKGKPNRKGQRWEFVDQKSSDQSRDSRSAAHSAASLVDHHK